MKKTRSLFEYPVVVRKVMDDLIFSVPDLGIWIKVPSPPKQKIRGKMHAVFPEKYLGRLGLGMHQCWTEIDRHLRKKAWRPHPSQIKMTLEKGDLKNLSLPAFTKIVCKQILVSQDTVRRDIERGLIKAYKTSGGHRRIPHTEAAFYIQYLEKRVKHTPHTVALARGSAHGK